MKLWFVFSYVHNIARERFTTRGEERMQTKVKELFDFVKSFFRIWEKPFALKPY